jgi:hypothetical protein
MAVHGERSGGGCAATHNRVANQARAGFAAARTSQLAGVETLETNTDQLEVIRQVLRAIDSSIHVRPIVYMDAELPFVPEKDAPGVTAYREAVKAALAGQKITSLPHEQIIAKVDEVGKTFHIVVLKTTMTVPYTSVFLQLNCKYWSDEAEAQMRKAMRGAPRNSAGALNQQ